MLLRVLFFSVEFQDPQFGLLFVEMDRVGTCYYFFKRRRRRIRIIFDITLVGGMRDFFSQNYLSHKRFQPKLGFVKEGIVNGIRERKDQWMKLKCYAIFIKRWNEMELHVRMSHISNIMMQDRKRAIITCMCVSWNQETSRSLHRK